MQHLVQYTVLASVMADRAGGRRPVDDGGRRPPEGPPVGCRFDTHRATADERR